MKQKFRQLYHLKLRNVNDTEIPPNVNVVVPPQGEDEDDIDGVRRRNEIMNILEIGI